MQHSNCYSNVKSTDLSIASLIPVGRSQVNHVFRHTFLLIIKIFIIIVVLYLFQSACRPFLIPCYNIIQCIVFSFVYYHSLRSYLYQSIYLYHSFETLVLLDAITGIFL